jgi:hypothetical protein
MGFVAGGTIAIVEPVLGRGAMSRLSVFVLAQLVLFAIPGGAEEVERLRDVKSIHVASLGTAQGASLIREKIVRKLTAARVFSLVDAVLTGVGEIAVEPGHSLPGIPGEPRPRAALALRLVSREKRVLWTGEAYPRFFSRSASSSLADRGARDLLRAMQEDAAGGR